jgi:hypothetical protein
LLERMLNPKVMIAVDALVAVLCAVTAIVFANVPSTSPAPTTNSAFIAPLGRAVGAAPGNAAAAIALSARHVPLAKTVPASPATPASAPSTPSAAPGQPGRSSMTDQQSKDCVPPATSGCPNPGKTYAPQQRWSVRRRSPSTSMASATSTSAPAATPAPVTCADGNPAPCPRVPLPHMPLPPRVPLPHVPLPDVPQCTIETAPGHYIRVGC